MDVLFSSDPSRIHRLRGALQPYARDYPARRVFEFSGAWGCLVATGSQYRGLDPCEADGRVTVVLGDPLCGAVAVEPTAGGEGAARTAAIARHWRDQGAKMRLHHPAAIVSVCTSSGAVDVIVDAWGAAPVYATAGGGPLILGSSPDLIALAHPCRFDRLSAMERLCARQISFPNTLYTNIKELPPGATTRFAADSARNTMRWWTPPPPDSGPGVEDWAAVLHEGMLDTLRRLRREVSTAGVVTLSAGLDSRFLLSMIRREGVLDVTAINLAATANISSWIAARIAATFDVPIELRTRRQDHYSAILLARHPEIGTNACLQDAHFGEKGLGDVRGSPILLGGFMADTILVRGDPFTGDREKGLRDKSIERSAPRWAIDPVYGTVDLRMREAITERWDAAERLLGIEDYHSETLRRIFPATRQGHKGHFDAARRSYPIYEPFMTAPAVELGFRIPEQLKAPRSMKQRYYGRYLDATADIPVNPASEKAFKELVVSVKRLLPEDLWPDAITHSDEWSELRGALAQQAALENAHAREVLADVLPIDLSGLRGLRMGSIVTTTVHALERCTEV